jgi:IS30 family transposase
MHLPNGHSAIEVEAAMKKAIKRMPKELRKSLTWDQGSEMARHLEISVASGISIYFCDPNLKDLLKIEASLNGRPRKTINYMTPKEKLAELVALST